ncbi:lipocalin family protein [Melioribacter sp. OK-6-Me]|uniref:lipocalin family protein n=1 Tax=unclassified Melioribacter TaxID=2627329 RepID=UPI003EDA2EC7
MKNLLKSLFILLLFTFISCSEDSNPTSSEPTLTGTWKLTAITVHTGSGDVKLLPDALGYSMTVVLNEDGTYQATYKDPEGENTETGTWTEADGKLTITIDGVSETVEYTLSGNKLTFNTTMEIEGFGVQSVTLEFTKQ